MSRRLILAAFLVAALGVPAFAQAPTPPEAPAPVAVPSVPPAAPPPPAPAPPAPATATPSAPATEGTGAPAAPAAPKAPETRLLARSEAMPILGQDVAASSGAIVGHLIDVLVGQDGQPRAAVLDVGGFLGVGSRDVSVEWSTLHFSPTDKQHPITTSLTPDQVRAAPEYKISDQPTPVVVPSKG